MPRWRTAYARLRRRIPVSLGAKLVAFLTAVALLGAGGVTLLLALVITPGFDQLEQAAVNGHVERTRAALTEYASKVEASVRDYGDWSESYDYMGTPNKAFEEDSFATSAMINLGVNGMAYVTPQGKVVIARWLDLENGRDVPAMRARLLEAVGRIDFRDGILFVPEVLLAANAMKAGMEVLRPLLAVTGAETIELRRWVIGPEKNSRGRRRGLSARLADIASYDEAGAKAIAAAREAAEALPGDGWLQRLVENYPSGPLEETRADTREVGPDPAQRSRQYAVQRGR